MKLFAPASRLALAALLACSVSANAADPWSTTDKALAAAFVVASVADWRQTREITKYEGVYETNPFLGHHPSNRRIDTYFVVSRLLTLGAAHFIPSGYRTAFLAGNVVVQLWYTTNNARIGLKVGF